MPSDCGCNGTPPAESYAAPVTPYVIEGDESGTQYASLVEAMRAAPAGKRIVPVLA